MSKNQEAKAAIILKLLGKLKDSSKSKKESVDEMLAVDPGLKSLVLEQRPQKDGTLYLVFEKKNKKKVDAYLKKNKYKVEDDDTSSNPILYWVKK